MSINPKTIAANVYSRRYSAGMSQRDLAKKAGISTNTVNKVEKGNQRPTPMTLRKLAAALGVEPVALLEGDK